MELEIANHTIPKAVPEDVVCPPGSVVPPGIVLYSSADCACGVGWAEGSDEQCEPCGMGTFKSRVSVARSRAQGGSGSACEACPSEKPVTQGTGAVSAEECGCSPGSVDVEGVCVECPQDSYCDDGFSVRSCPANSGTQAGGARSEAECQCLAGHYRGAGSCIPCASGLYKAAVSDALCSECPENSGSEPGAASVSGCVCLPGFTSVVGVGCVACPGGTEWSPEGVCLECEPGSAGPGGGEPCTLCDGSSFQDTRGRESCAACPDGASTSAHGARDAAACRCGDGEEARGLG